MIRSDFRILKIDLSSGKGRMLKAEIRWQADGLAALLFSIYGHADKPWDDPDQPIIFVIGPLTGYFPLMSKTVCAFKSPIITSIRRVTVAVVLLWLCGLPM